MMGPAGFSLGKNSSGVPMPAKSESTLAQHGSPAHHNGNGHGSGLDKKKLLATLEAFRQGDFNAHLEGDWVGLDRRIVDTLNQVIEQNRHLSRELEKVNRTVGKEG